MDTPPVWQQPITRRHALRAAWGAGLGLLLAGVPAGCGGSERAAAPPSSTTLSPTPAPAAASSPSPAATRTAPAAVQRQDGEVVSDGLRIHYVVEGQGTPVVLLHGMGSSYQANWVATGWNRLLTSAGYQVIGIDDRGCGQSDRVTDPALFRDGPCLHDITAVVDKLGVKTAHYLGYSMGSGYALRMALTYPQRVRSLILGGTGGGALAGAGLRLEDEAASRTLLLRWRTLLVATFAQQGEYGRQYAQAMGDAFLLDTQAWGNLESLAVPTLIVVGENDTAQGEFGAFSTTQMLARRIPDVRRLVVPGADHNGAVARTEFKEAALAFLASR